MSELELKVGDTFTWDRSHRADVNVTVSRVGRKWAYVSLDGRERPERFDKFTGYEEGRWGSRSRLVSPAILAAEARRGKVLEKLNRHRIFDLFGTNKLTTDQLERICAIVEEINV